jgi:hypothetical protein
MDRLVIMLENELDQCCLYPGPAARIPNPSSRQFVAETCYLLWQCMLLVGARPSLIAQKVPLMALASRLVLGQLDPELRGLAPFGKYFIHFIDEKSKEQPPEMAEAEAAAAAAAQQERERERSEGNSSPPR